MTVLNGTLRRGHRAWRPVGGAAVLAAMVTMGVAAPAGAVPAVGEPAPGFTGTDTAGEAHTLADYAGKLVVLEWTNHECPYTRKHYESGNMQALQKDAAADGVVWLSVISSAPGEQGYVSADQADALTQRRDAAPSAVLLDPDGDIGRLYGAKTTPHMYVIDTSGTLVYMGAIDDQPSAYGDPSDAQNYVRKALSAVSEGQPVQTASTRPYGCTVKYAK